MNIDELSKAEIDCLLSGLDHYRAAIIERDSNQDTVSTRKRLEINHLYQRLFERAEVIKGITPRFATERDEPNAT